VLPPVLHGQFDNCLYDEATPRRIQFFPRRMIREFLEKVYNQKRRHSALGTEIMPFPHSVRRTETGQSNQSIARRLSVAISTRHFSGLAFITG
jgi:hypothetical protein